MVRKHAASFLDELFVPYCENNILPLVAISGYVNLTHSFRNLFIFRFLLILLPHVSLILTNSKTLQGFLSKFLRVSNLSLPCCIPRLLHYPYFIIKKKKILENHILYSSFLANFCSLLLYPRLLSKNI